MPHSPPKAEKRPNTRTVHGVHLTDDYAWLRADNWQDVLRDGSQLPQHIRAHLEAETAYADAMLAPDKALCDTLFEELKGRIKVDDSTVPSPDGPYEYYSRFREGGQHRLYCRRKRGSSEEIVLLDGDALAEGKSYFSIGNVAPSPDHTLIAWSCDDNGSEFHDIRVLDTRTGECLPDLVPDSGGETVWRTDGRAFFYVRLDENHRPSSIWEHCLGTHAQQDRLVYEENDAGMFVGLARTSARRFAAIMIHDHETSEVRLIDLDRPGDTPRQIEARQPHTHYDIGHWHDDGQDDRIFILTNADGAEDFKIAVAPLATPGRAHWHDIIPHQPGKLILSMAVFSSWLVRLEREEGLPRIVIRNLSDDSEHTVAFEEEVYALGLDPGAEFATDIIRFVYSSPTSPAQTWDYNMRTRERILRKTQEIPSGHDPSLYTARRVFAPAADGETVPVSLLYLKDTPLDGSAPLLLYGYGAYGHSIPAGFSTSALSLVNRGFVCAIAHIRGGTEKGWRWYREGKLEKKTNTFNDFIAAGEYLARNRFTARGRIIAHGGSAGGMLMGAVANLAPDLFGAIIAEVPFVDVLCTMLDDTLPLTPPEWPEWGNPITDETAFRHILSYSPVDNVTRQAYPPILVLAGLTDPRVTYWEPAKWVAHLREKSTSDSPVIFRLNMETGHSGASGRFESLREVALVQAFAIRTMGLHQTDTAIL